MKYLVILSMLVSSAAFAADKKAPAASNDDVLDKPTSDAPAKAEKSDDTGAKVDEPEKAKSTPAAEGQAPATGPVEETIFVVQGKPFLSQGKFELSPQIIQSVNDSFTSHTGLAASGLYHLKENVAFEVAGGVFGWWDVGGPRFGGRDSSLTVELRQKESLAPERVKLYQFQYFLAADAQWSPLYGKVSVQDLALGQFNLYLSVGAGVFGLQLESLTQNGVTKAYVPLAPTFGVLPTMAASTTFGGGLRFYFTDWLGVRLEVRDYVIPLAVHDTGADAVSDAGDGPSFDVTNLVLAQVGVSFVF
jgi:outer membrane beta-barrel protein